MAPCSVPTLFGEQHTAFTHIPKQSPLLAHLLRSSVQAYWGLSNSVIQHLVPTIRQPIIQAEIRDDSLPTLETVVHRAAHV